MLGQMKGIKATGLLPAFSGQIHKSRLEIKLSKKYRLYSLSLHVIGKLSQFVLRLEPGVGLMTLST
jgi:hypothetical protein